MLMLPAPGSPRSLACYCSILPAHGYYEHKAQPVWIEYHFDKGGKRVGGIYPRSCPKWTCSVTLIASLILARNMLLWWVCLLVHLNLHLHVQSGGSGEIGASLACFYHELKVIDPGRRSALRLQKWLSHRTLTGYTTSPLFNFLSTCFSSERFKKGQSPNWWRISRKSESESVSRSIVFDSWQLHGL